MKFVKYPTFSATKGVKIASPADITLVAGLAHKPRTGGGLYILR